MERFSAPVVAALERGGTVVTADVHQAYRIRLAWADRQRAAAAASWPSPDVLPLGAALSRAWMQALLDGDVERSTLLSAHQERTVWEQIVRDAGGEQHFLQPHGTVRAVMRSWQRMQEWAIDAAAVARSPVDDVRTFSGWARAFAERCRKRNWIDRASALRQMPVPRQRGASWVAIGFDAPPASLQALLARFEREGVDVRLAQGPAVESRVARAAFADSHAEWRAVATWARRRLLANPQQRLVVLIPELEHERERVERTFEEILRPLVRMNGPASPAVPFIVEGGMPLAGYPLVGAALTAIAMVCAPQPFDVVSAWLRSPYVLNGSARAAERARLDLEIRRHAGHELDIAALARALERAARYLAIDDPLIAACVAFQRLLGGRAGLAQWGAVLSEALRVLGWPGARERASAEQQTLEKFNATLAELATLDDIVGTVDVPGMLRQLRALAEQTPFQPETGDAPLILTARLADPALGLDGLWVTGLEANAWPRAPRPDPFLPWELQRAAGIPDASAEGMLGLARRLTGRWSASAGEVIFSWPQRRDDEDCLPSALLSGLPQYPAADGLTAPAREHWHLIRATAQLETFTDEIGPPLPPGARFAGGARALTLQSQCAMHAFAERRLEARPFEVPALGIDARTRGKLVHHALWLLWSEIETQEQLRALEPLAREALVSAIVAQACAQILERPARWPVRLVQLERNRLRSLLDEWLVIELGRAPFRVVGAEQSMAAVVGGHPIELRVDRIDELGDARRLLIDYKTGQATPAAWFGERPDDAQLPLYAAVLETGVDGIAIARLRAGDCGLKGASSRPSMTRGKYDPEDWSVQLAAWRRTVERLALEHARGDARVNPKQRQTCGNCHLHSFCRIDEIRLAQGEDRVDDD